MIKRSIEVLQLLMKIRKLTWREREREKEKGKEDGGRKDSGRRKGGEKEYEVYIPIQYSCMQIYVP